MGFGAQTKIPLQLCKGSQEKRWLYHNAIKKKDPDQMNDRDPRRRRRPIDDEAKSHAFVPVTTLTFAVDKKSAALPQCDKKKDPDQMNDRDPRRRRRPTLPPGVAVPSAQTGLTSLFGMVRGGPRRHGHLKIKLLVFCS